VDSWWDTKNLNGELYLGEWLVVKPTCTVNASGGVFTRKTIWLFENKQVSGTWFNCSNASNTLMYVYGTGNSSIGYGHVNGLTVGNFRGLIFCDSNVPYNHNYVFTTGAIFYGAIHHKRGGFNVNSGGNLDLRFKPGSLGESALQEIVNTAVVLGPGVTVPPVPVPTVSDKKIRPALVFMQL
jgi:hypothetical protein